MPLVKEPAAHRKTQQKAAENKPTRRRVVAMAALRRWLAMHAALVAAATTLRDLCPNKHFEATLEDIDDEVLRGPPYDDVRDQLALRHATEGRKGLEIGGPTPLAANLYGLLASCDNLATSRPASVLRTVNATRFAATSWGQYIMQTHTGSRITSTGDQSS
jgi:hypothetical protein